MTHITHVSTYSGHHKGGRYQRKEQLLLNIAILIYQIAALGVVKFFLCVCVIINVL